MSTYSLSHLADRTLLHDLAALVARDRANTAELLAHLAEVDARKLYLPAAYPSMYAYCVGELHMSEDAAFKRIRVARTARAFPAIFAAVADGRLHLSAVVLLASYLTTETADELLAAAAHRSKSEIEQLLAERFPRPDLPSELRAIPQLAPGPIEPGAEVGGVPSAGTIELAPGPVAPRTRLSPLAPERFALQVTIGRSTHDKLRHAQAMLSHRVPSGDVAAVLDLVLDMAIEQLEKRKFAATCRPRSGQRPSHANGRYIPAEVRRAVWQRDGGRCTSVSDSGQRCAERKLLEFDHVQERARGGLATISGMRLRCHAHNQYGAERTFGSAFMRHKRDRARYTHEQAATVEPAPERDASLDARVRAALGFLMPAHRRVAAPTPAACGSASS